MSCLSFESKTTSPFATASASGWKYPIGFSVFFQEKMVGEYIDLKNEIIQVLKGRSSKGRKAKAAPKIPKRIIKGHLIIPGKLEE